MKTDEFGRFGAFTVFLLVSSCCQEEKEMPSKNQHVFMMWKVKRSSWEFFLDFTVFVIGIIFLLGNMWAEFWSRPSLMSRLFCPLGPYLLWFMPPQQKKENVPTASTFDGFTPPASTRCYLSHPPFSFFPKIESSSSPTRRWRTAPSSSVTTPSAGCAVTPGRRWCRSRVPAASCTDPTPRDRRWPRWLKLCWEPRRGEWRWACTPKKVSHRDHPPLDPSVSGHGKAGDSFTESDI